MCNENNKEPLVTTVNLPTHSCSSSSVRSAKIYFSLKTPKVDDTGKLLTFNGMKLSMTFVSSVSLSYFTSGILTTSKLFN